MLDLGLEGAGIFAIDGADYLPGEASFGDVDGAEGGAIAGDESGDGESVDEVIVDKYFGLLGRLVAGGIVGDGDGAVAVDGESVEFAGPGLGGFRGSASELIELPGGEDGDASQDESSDDDEDSDDILF